MSDCLNLPTQALQRPHGTEEAVEQLCLCRVIDTERHQHHGRFVYRKSPDRWEEEEVKGPAVQLPLPDLPPLADDPDSLDGREAEEKAKRPRSTSTTPGLEAAQLEA